MNAREPSLPLQDLMTSASGSMRMAATFLRVQLVGIIGLLMEEDVPVQATKGSEAAPLDEAELYWREEAVVDVETNMVKTPSDTKAMTMKQ